MRKITLLIVTFIIIGSNIAKAQTSSFLKISVGENFLSVIADDSKYKTFGLSINNFLPSVRFESYPLLYEGNKYDMFVNLGFGISYYGYKYELSTDTTIYNKSTGMPFIGGFGFTSYLIEDLPVSITINYQYAPTITSKNYINEDKINSVFKEEAQQGIAGRIDLRLVDGISFRLSAYYQAEMYFTSNGTPNNIYRYLTHSIGISISFENGIYQTINL